MIYNQKKNLSIETNFLAIPMLDVTDKFVANMLKNQWEKQIVSNGRRSETIRKNEAVRKIDILKMRI
jgi:hypothetical protein